MKIQVIIPELPSIKKNPDGSEYIEARELHAFLYKMQQIIDRITKEI